MNDIGKDTLAAMALAYKYRAEEAEDRIEVLEAKLKQALEQQLAEQDAVIERVRELRCSVKMLRNTTCLKDDVALWAALLKDLDKALAND